MLFQSNGTCWKKSRWPEDLRWTDGRRRSRVSVDGSGWCRWKLNAARILKQYLLSLFSSFSDVHPQQDSDMRFLQFFAVAQCVLAARTMMIATVCVCVWGGGGQKVEEEGSLYGWFECPHWGGSHHHPSPAEDSSILTRQWSEGEKKSQFWR